MKLGGKEMAGLLIIRHTQGKRIHVALCHLHPLYTMAVDRVAPVRKHATVPASQIVEAPAPERKHR